MDESGVAPLNRDGLRRALDREGINPDCFSLEGGHPPERLVLSMVPGGWVVYYSERGIESGRRDFTTEDEACRYMLESLLRDPTTHFHLVVGPLPADEADKAFDEWRAVYGIELAAEDVCVDNPQVTASERVRRYWVRGTKLPR